MRDPFADSLVIIFYRGYTLNIRASFVKPRVLFLCLSFTALISVSPRIKSRPEKKFFSGGKR